MKHPYHAGFAALSLVLLLISSVLWVRSGDIGRQLWKHRAKDGKSESGWYTQHGRLTYEAEWIVPAAPLPPTTHSLLPMWMRAIGLTAVEGPTGVVHVWWRVKKSKSKAKTKPATAIASPKHYNYVAKRTVGFELWAIACASVILPITFLVTNMKRAGPVYVCANCGYETATQPRACPVCGGISEKPERAPYEPLVDPATQQAEDTEDVDAT